MKKKIAVVGMGQGGMVAAINLAEKFDVTIYEKNEKDKVGYEWRDDITSAIFSEVGLPLPDGIFCQKPKWIFVAPDYKGVLRIPQLRPYEEISVYRRGLSEYFAKLAENAGCKIVYGKEVTGLVVKGERTVGIRTTEGEEIFDLVIDASGLNSVLRKDIPEKFSVQKEPSGNDVLYGYRAFFKAAGKTFDSESDCTMVIKHLGENGISWCNLNDEGNVDVLIGRVGKLIDDDIEKGLLDLREHNPVLGGEKIKEYKVPICLRRPIAVPVADGYVALGDSAFMPVPIMGSGIESSMRAGKIFATYVLNNGIEEFSASKTWGFFVEFMSKFGKDFVFTDLLRRYALRLPTEYINRYFSCGIITDEDLKTIMLDDYDSSDGIGHWLKKPFILIKLGKSGRKLISVFVKSLKGSKIVKKIPKTYDIEKISKWRALYDAVSESADGIE